MSLFLSGQVATQEQIDSFNQLIDSDASTIPTGFNNTSTISETTLSSPSFQSSFSTISNILQGLELPETFRESVFSGNQLLLGQASVDISKALTEQSSQVQEQFGSLNQWLTDFQAQVSSQLTQLGGSVTDASNAAGQDNGSNPLGFLFENPLFLGLGVGGLAVGGIALLLLLKR